MEPTGHDEVERQLAELDAIRRRVMNVVGHAMRTPMATLRGLVEVVAKDPDAARRPEITDALVRTTRRLERLLDDVLVASDVTTRLPTATPQVVDPLAAARRVWAELGQAEDDLVLVGDVRVEVGTDGLRWMLFHVLENAVHYGRPPLTLTGTTTSGRTTLSFDSPGDPLPPADLANATELFYRGEAAVMANTSGMGVGLTVVARLAAHAGGTVAVREREGGGVITDLVLPAG